MGGELGGVDGAESESLEALVAKTAVDVDVDGVAVDDAINFSDVRVWFASAWRQLGEGVAGGAAAMFPGADDDAVAGTGDTVEVEAPTLVEAEIEQKVSFPVRSCASTYIIGVELAAV